MGTIVGTAIALKVGYTLSDTAHVRWTDAELLAWINLAQAEIQSFKPNVFMLTANIALVAGSKQAIAAEHSSLIDVIRNMGTGAAAGAGIRPVERAHLDVAFADWHLAEYADKRVQCFWFDERDQKIFYVFPTQPADTDQEIEVKVSAPPTPLAALTETIAIDNSWEPAIIDYVLFRAFGKDTTSAPNRERSDKHYQAFMRSMGVRTAIDPAYAPDKDDLGGVNANAPERPVV